MRGEPDDEALQSMRCGGLDIRGSITRPPLKVSRLDKSKVNSVLSPPCMGMDRPGTWLEIVLNEGKNRQVRRMTAATGHPTIRLVRVAIGFLSLLEITLEPGQWNMIQPKYVLNGEFV